MLVTAPRRRTAHRSTHRTTPGTTLRTALVAAAVAAVAATLLTPAGRAHAAPPVNPSDQQISSAAAQKSALAVQVGKLGAEIAAQQNELNQLKAAQEMAEQKLAYAMWKLSVAKQQSAVAKADVAKAQRRVDAAQVDYANFAAAAYMNGSIGGMTGSLLTASDPSALLQQSALQNYESQNQLSAVDNLSRATVAKSNADARARAAVALQDQLTVQAAQAKHAADVAVVAAIAQEKQLQASLASNTAALQQAQERLATLNNQRAAYDAWLKKQQEIAAAQARARALAAAKARAAALAAQRQQQQQQQQGGGSGGGGSSTPVQPSGGSWTAQKGQEAVARAMRYLGWMYAWAGGNSNGPTYGVCAGDGAYNDCHVIGFDCSGLTLYGWAPFEAMPHYSVSQYDAGSFHPSISQLLPGDLVFWSSNGMQSGVHHVAMYIGGGNVIQAPESGEVIQITPLVDVDWGYFGATRPLT